MSNPNFSIRKSKSDFIATGILLIDPKIEEILQHRQFVRREFLIDNPVPDPNIIPKKNKNYFRAITHFASTNSNLSYKELYSKRELPSKFMKTPLKIIKDLTRDVYAKPKQIQFPLKLNFIEKSGLKKQKNLVLNQTHSPETLKNYSYGSPFNLKPTNISNPDACDNITKSCNQLLRSNRKCKSVVLKKT